MSESTPEQRAAEGAKLLDSHRPGWEKQLPSAFDQAEPWSCVLYHVFGDYSGGLEELDMRYQHDREVQYGFESTFAGYGDGTDERRANRAEDFRRLNAAWQDEAAKRLAKGTNHLQNALKSPLEPDPFNP